MKIQAILILTLAFVSLKHTASFAAESRNAYLSDVDAALTIHSLAVLPANDNVGGLYARPVEAVVRDLAHQAHRFEMREIKSADMTKTLDDYESRQILVKSVALNAEVDSLVGISIFKDESGVTLKLDLFLKSDGFLLAQETLKLDHRFASSEVEKAARELYAKLIKKIPYDGLILSREGNRVTIDVGTLDGVSEGTVVTVDQIISLNRHPKYHFALGAERVTLGKIKLVKVDETLSFGMIIQEKDRGVISPDGKISGLDFVSYVNRDRPDEGSPASENKMTFNNKPEFLPVVRPSFGKVGVSLGVGSFRSALSFQTIGSYEGDSSFYPQLQLAGEIWITKNWYAGTAIRQGTTSSLSSSAGNVSGGVTTTDYDLYAGYKFLLQDEDFWGPQINLHLGFSSNAMTVDSASATSLSSTRYSGLYYGLGGAIPLTNKKNINLDLGLDRFFQPQFSETPYASGATSSSSAMRISFGGNYELTNNVWLGLHLFYELYSTDFSGTGGRQDIGLNSSQSMTSLITSLNYCF